MRHSILLLLLAISLVSNGQQLNKKWNLTVTIEDMYSTHSTHFAGAAIGVSKRLNKSLELGTGIQYAYSKYHDDNGWDLYRLKFLPIYTNQIIHIWGDRKFHPYIHLQEGITFKKYEKRLEKAPLNTPTTPVREAGFYGYGGLGALYSVNDNLRIVAEVGIKSFHISMNELEVNPHGVTGKIGMSINLR